MLLFPVSETTTVPLEFNNSNRYFVNTGALAVTPLDGSVPFQLELYIFIAENCAVENLLITIGMLLAIEPEVPKIRLTD